MLLGLVLRDRRAACELLGQPMPRRRARVLPAGRRPGRGAGGVPAPVRAHPPGAAGRDGPGRRAVGPKRRVDEALDQVGLGGVDGRPVKAYSLGMRQRLGLAAALLRDPDCWSSTSRRTALTRKGIREIRELLLRAERRRARRSSCPATCWPRSSRCAPGSACSTAGRLVLQASWPTLRAPTGRVVVHAPRDARRAGAARRSASRVGASTTRGPVRARRPGRAQRRSWSTAGVRVDGARPRSGARWRTSSWRPPARARDRSIGPAR